MVTYLNRRNKQNIMMVALLTGLLPAIEESLKLDGYTRKNFRMAATWAKKGMDNILGSIELTQAKALIRAVKHNQLELVPDYSKFSETVLKESTNAMNVIAEVAMESKCRGCTIEDVEGCELRKAMINFDIAVLKEECAEGECPYYMEA